MESDSFPWPLEAPGVSSSTEHPRGWRSPWMSSAPRHTPGQNSLKEQEWLWNISPLQILNVGVASSSLHPSNRGMVFSRIHLQSRGMTVPGARHSSSPAAGRDKTSTAKTPPRFRALRRNHPRQLPGSSQGTRGLQELERDEGTCWERDPEGECGRKLQLCSLGKRAPSTTLAQLGTAPGTRSPWELGMCRRAGAKSFSSSFFLSIQSENSC